MYSEFTSSPNACDADIKSDRKLVTGALFSEFLKFSTLEITLVPNTESVVIFLPS